MELSNVLYFGVSPFNNLVATPTRPLVSAGDRVEDNLNPAGRMFYSISTLVCTPNALSQQAPGAPEPLGTQAGEARLREVALAAGFTRVRRVPVDAPLNLVLELRA